MGLMKEAEEEVMDGYEDRGRVSGHKSCYNQPALQHRPKSMNIWD